jgi:DNA modification methylase
MGRANVGESVAAAAEPIKVVYRQISELHPDPTNPRLHPPRQVKQIARSIREFGFNVPILIDASLKVVAGHGRLLASRQLGWRRVPTIRLDHLTDAQVLAFRIADNRLTENSTWNDQLLAEQLSELSLLELDFSLDITGFEMGEIDLRIEGLAAEHDGSDPADAVPTVASAPPVSQAGDQWLLGAHRVLCASALEQLAYSRLMQGERAAAVFTDPPYNVPIAGHVSGLGAIQHREFMMASGEMTDTEFTSFLTEICARLAHHSMNGSLHYICIDWRHLYELLSAGKRVYSSLQNICVWAKDNPGMGSMYRSGHEMVAVFKHGRKAHRNNIRLGQYGRNRSNVWHYAGANSFGKPTDEGNLLVLHPTVKPAALVADAILDCTARGDLVLDAFLGSGTTIIAAQRTGRVCRGLELDPRYVDTAIRRWQAFTGDTARHAASGRSFTELEAEKEKCGAV